MADPRLVREWLDRAEDDFAFALANLQDARPFFAQICFHFHQAAEKYLKAYVVAHDLEFRKIHDLALLIRICSAYDSDASALREACEFLSPFYIETRYPVHWPAQHGLDEAEKARDAACEIGAWVKQRTG